MRLLASPYAVLASRLVLGGVFAAAGAAKIPDPGFFAAAIRSYGLGLPEWFVSLAAYGLPYLEVLLGLYLMAGLFTRLAAWTANALMCVFILAILQAAVRGLEISCGCFGPSSEPSNLWLDLLRDLGLLALGLHAAFFPPGRFSVDALLGRGTTETSRRPG
ncbi:hypothetical protein Rxycam_02067 [Rubrobacter xylanophilus DSM 9941]|uniref:MauE/DoxX family redox-associated membrane protein n=1 Tax=Rubrobacter xylanophilus TaxID=49319 RepID=UPI001C643BDA|nr:MauE/DoxX family redox-associated membrane protein [Rubrobacter xylanophilus]QYJ16234.1 hypothetical protein Rxycam_02067 [Rubrobacter xylanophilus DSM 9941]